MRLVQAASNVSGLLLASLFFSAPLTAAVLLVGGQEGTSDPPSPTEGAETEEDWNPIVTCSVTPGGSIEELLYCLLDEIATPPPPCPTLGGLETHSPGGGRLARRYAGEPCSDPDSRQDFNVTLVPPPQYGVQILRLDGSEIERIALRENDPGIQTTELRNERPYRVARVRQIEETPEGGEVHIVVDDVEVTLSFGHGPVATQVEINADMARGLRAGGLTIAYQAPYFFISNHTGIPRGVHVLQYRSTDPGITRSDLALLPEDDPSVPTAESQP